MPATNPTYWIAYGFCEGPRHARFLHQELARQGYAPADSLPEADIVIAHSGGCFDLPSGPQRQHVFLCQPACGYPEKGPQLLARKVGLDLLAHRQRGQLGRWVWKSGLNLRYGVRYAQKNRRIIRQAARFRQVLAPVEAANVTVVISRHDPFSRHLPLNEVRLHPNRRFVGVEGGHDDLWTNPAVICQLIRAAYAT